MRKYLFSTGLFGVLTGGLTLLKELRSDSPFTWRTALAWVSWALSLALAIGAVVDVRRASRGELIDDDSPVAGKQQKLLRKQLKKLN